MLDIDKIEKEATELIRSFTREDLLEWIAFDKKRMALARKEERMARLGLNGTPHSAAKSKGVPVKKTTRSRATAKA